MMRFKLTLLSLLVLSAVAHAEGTTSVKGFGVGKAKATISPIVGYFYPKNPSPTGFREQAMAGGGAIDLLSYITLDTSYRQKISNSKGWTFNIPLTVEYGIRLAALHFHKIFQNGSAMQLSAVGHLDLFRIVSLGGGAYRASYGGDRPGHMPTAGYGGILDGTLHFFQSSAVRPMVEVRYLGGSMKGMQYLIGITLGNPP